MTDTYGMETWKETSDASHWSYLSRDSLSKSLECRSSIHSPSIDALEESCPWLLNTIQPVCPKYRCSGRVLSLVTQNWTILPQVSILSKSVVPSSTWFGQSVPSIDALEEPSAISFKLQRNLFRKSQTTHASSTHAFPLSFYRVKEITFTVYA